MASSFFTYLDDGAEVVEANVARVADVVLAELLLQDIGGDFAVDFLHELLELLATYLQHLIFLATYEWDQ